MSSDGSTMTLGELVRAAFETAKSKGWHDNVADWVLANATHVLDGTKQKARDELAALLFGARIALIDSEAAEALEAYRTDKLKTWHREDGKPEGVVYELADVVIRVADLCGALGLDLAAAVAEKLDYNASRTHRHGGKAL